MSVMYKYADDDLMDVDEMYAEEIVIEEGTWETIKERAARTGENPDDLAEEFKKYLEDMRSQISEETLEWYRLVYSYASQKKLKTAV